MSRTESSKPRRKFGCVWLIVFVLVAVVGYSAIRYFVDQNNYNKGHQAYQQANCAVAIGHFDSVINARRLVDIGGYPALADREKAECLPYQAALDKQQAGELSAALIAYADFVANHHSGVLAEAARNNSASLFEQAEPSALASQETCERVDALLEQSLIPQLDINLPPFYLACSQVYDTAGNHRGSFAFQEALLTEYPNHSLASDAEASLMANPVACEETNSLQKNSVIAGRTDFMPKLYYGCGQAHDAEDEHASSFKMYKIFLTQYPEHSLAPEVETALLANPTSCWEYETLRDTEIAERADFMPSLYYRCGQTYEDDGDWADAITMYESFLADYPDHSLASDVETALAGAIVARAKATGAGEIPPPERSGTTGSGLTEVIIQNDSPQPLRIVFSGPDSRVEELGACSSCSTYTGIGPMFCPEKGPIGRYTLEPGEYDVVVESTSDRGVTPFKGSWTLKGGEEYYNCFFIVTTFG